MNCVNDYVLALQDAWNKSKLLADLSSFDGVDEDILLPATESASNLRKTMSAQLREEVTRLESLESVMEAASHLYSLIQNQA